MPVEGWARVWRGDRAGAEAAMARASAIYRQFRGIRLMSERFAQFRTLMCGVSSDLAGMDAGGTRDDRRPAGPRSQRASRGVGARLPACACAHALDPRQYSRPGRHSRCRCWRRARRWNGHSSTWRARWYAASGALVERDWNDRRNRARTHPAASRPAAVADDLLRSAHFAGLRAVARRQGGDARQAFEPVFAETTQRFGMGLLLLDSRAQVTELLDIAPAAVRNSTAMQHLRGVLQQWSAAAVAPARPRLADSLTGPLSEREREVLEMVGLRSEQQTYCARAGTEPAHRQAAHLQHPGQAGLRFARPGRGSVSPGGARLRADGSFD